MKRLAQALKKRTFPVLTLVVLIAFGLGYYLFYVRNWESYFTQRYFRLLAFESGRIEERLSTFESILANIEQDPTLQQYPAETLEDLPGLERVMRVPSDFHIRDTDSGDIEIIRQGRIEGGRFWLYAGWKQGLQKKDVVYRFDPFVGSPPEDLETVFVADLDGTVLYQGTQRDRRALRIVNVSKFLAEDGTALDLSTFAGSTTRLDVLFAGEPYKLFMRPCCRTIWEPSREQSVKAQAPQRIQIDVKIEPSGVARAEASAPSQPTEASIGKDPSFEWVVGVLIRSSTLSTKSWAISFTVGIILISLFIFALLCLPFIRILAMGAEEKLRVNDALWVGFTAIVGVGLLTLLLADLHAYQALLDKADRLLERLAVNIDDSMQSELNAARNQLKSFNGGVADKLGKGRPSSCRELQEAGIAARKNVNPASAPDYLDFERFTWMDTSGQQCFKWGVSFPSDRLVPSDPLVQVKGRRYLGEALDRKEAVEPVFSSATGSRVVVLATSIKDRPFVGVLGIEMNSLNRPVLPPGYGFAVIGDDGEVLFHSESGRAGYENFFEETDNDRALRALVFARRPGNVNAPYMGRGHRLRVQPIPLETQSGSWLRQSSFWTLIVFSDKRDLRAFNVDALTTAMLFLILYLLVYMVVCWSLRAANRGYRAGWLWPDRRGESRAKGHRVLVVFYLLCLVNSLLAIRLLDGLDLLWFTFMFPWAILLVSYRIVAGAIPKRRQLLLSAGLAATLLLIFWAPGSSASWKLGSLNADRVLVLLLTSIFLWIFFFFPSKALKAGAEPSRWTYVVAASLLLTLTAAVPAVSFLCIAHRAHLETRIKRGQLELALRSKDREDRLRKAYAAFAPLGYEQFLKTRLAKRWDIYYEFFFESTLADSLAGGQGQSERETCWLPHFVQTVLPLYTEDFIRVRRLSGDSQGTPWRWHHPTTGQLVLEGAPLHLSSMVPRMSLSGFVRLWPLSFLLLAGTIFGVAVFVARKFFLFGLAMPEVVEPTTAASDSTENFIFVSPHTDRVAERLRREGVAFLDLSKLDSHEALLRCLADADLVGKPRICLKHFEHRIQDEEHNRLKLELMEELILGRDKPVVVISHVVPTWYLLDRRPSPAAQDPAVDPDKAAKKLEAEEKARLEVQERWRRLLRRFVVWVWTSRADAERLETDLLTIEQTVPCKDRDGRLHRLLAVAREECSESEQLQPLVSELVRARLNDLSRELFLEDLRERAEPYYRALWAMCTEKEKVVLVHLAEGGLVNSRNAKPLGMLMRRGLVKKDPSFWLMNESFRRFVAADVCLNEVRDLEQKAEASAWRQIRGPLALSLIGVAAFFFITQREIFDISMAFFGAVAASLPAVFRVLGAATPSQGKAAP